MAKQSGIHQLRGKVGNMKYYRMKGVQDGLVQSINEGMSERVKNGAEYANTRRNNNEFGMAASTAGASIKSLSLRWRYLLKPFATGALAKIILHHAQASSQSFWGNRSVAPKIWQAAYPFEMSKFVKNDISDFGNLACSVNPVEGGITLNLIGEHLHNEKAESAGCNGVRCVFVGGMIETTANAGKIGGFVASSQKTEILTEIDVPFGNDVEERQDAPIIDKALRDDAIAAIGYVVLLPYREIGNEKVVMQEFASAIFASMPE